MTNKGNVDAGVTPVWVAGFPVGAQVDPGFTLTLPTPRERQLDYGQAPILFEVGGQGYMPFLLPRVPSGTSVSLPFSLTTTAIDELRLRAWANPCENTCSRARRRPPNRRYRLLPSRS